MRRYYALATENRTAQITIFGEITSWPWLESDVSSYNLQRQIQDLDVDEIDVHINSYGGEVAEALAITNALLRHPAKVNTYVDGFACSAATIVFMAGDRRIMSNISNFMVHPAWSTVSGNAEELRRQADDLDRITENSVTAYLSRITKSREELLTLMKEERFLTPHETLEWGFATEIEDVFQPATAAQSVAQKVYQLMHPETKTGEILISSGGVLENTAIIPGELSSLYSIDDGVITTSTELMNTPLATISLNGISAAPEAEPEQEKTILEKFLSAY